MATWAQWLLLTYLGICAAWMNERPVLESWDGNLFISAAKDRNITLKILGDGYVNVNEINLLHVASAAQNATRLIERLRTGYLAEMESSLQRLTQIVEGADGLEKRIAMYGKLVEANSSLPGNLNNQSTTGMNFKVRVLTNRLRRLEDKVKMIVTKLKRNECSSRPCQNGGTCQDLFEGYQCNCPSNWEGPDCTTDVNECVRLLGTDLGCQNGATCFNLPGSYRCGCAPGWHGIHCTSKTSVCNTQNSNELCGHGVCVSKPGSPLGYTCICDQGWQADGTNPACIKDVDECAANHRPCSVNPWVACRNAPGTFFCDACPRGYTGNGYYCTDIDECLVDNGGCSTSPRVECINTMGSRMCGTCPTGYRGDGITCVYVGSCAVNNGGCHPLATCIENPGLTSAYVLCQCPTGFTGNGVGPNGCRQTSTNVSTLNPCSSNPCIHGRCITDNIGSAYNCICEYRWSGANCDILDPCTPNPCKNSGACVNSSGIAICNCPSTFTGDRCETPRQTCGGVSRNPIGSLEFPSSGNVYQHGLSCAWVLNTNSSLVLNVTFTRFNIEQSTDCKYDFLQIHDGRNAGSQMIGRFCGNSLPQANGNIVSSHNSLYFWFHSDSSISHDGFAFHWNSIEPVCGGSLTDNYGTISSPGSPGRYPPNRDCYWHIMVHPTKRIQLHFSQVMIEEHPTCEHDYLRITSEGHEVLGLYCNHTRPPPLVVPGSEALLHFHSDGAGQDTGFQIHYSTIEGIPGCNGVFTTPFGEITLPKYMNSYLENMECDWRIQMPVGERVQITWSKFDLEHSINCQFDFVEIYDGPSVESPLLGRYCGSTLPPTLKSNTNVLLIVFKSDWALGKDGFTLSYNILCGGQFTEESGTLHSPMYPNPYQSSRMCMYDIIQPPGKRIVLNILDMEIEGLDQDNCYADYLNIYDGDNENSTKLATLCGGSWDMPTDPFYSTHNYMLLKFVTDTSVELTGFKANYSTIDSRCGGLLKASTGTIQYPTEGNSYANDEKCIWTIQAPQGYVVQISWLTFNVEYYPTCKYDHVTVYENYMKTDMNMLGTFCGTKKPPVLTSQGNVMTVSFTSDSSGTRDGFVASYLFLDASNTCGGYFVKPNGFIKTPNYPERYANRRECSWVIEAANKHRVVLNVKDFELEEHSSCSFDYLEIRNGGYETSPLIGKYCGTSIPTEIISQTNQLYLKFVSDSSRQAKGFNIEWDSTTSGCGGNLNAASGDIVSPNYPQPYQISDCYWKIAVAAGSWIQLLIVDLDLEHHDKCRFDYIEIYEDIDPGKRQRFCSNPYPKLIQTKSNTLNMRFRTDYTNSGRGFHLKYETLCHGKLHGFNGVIESPNFPEKYDGYLNCSWTIEAPIGNRINATISHFNSDEHIEPNSTCHNYLDIKEGEDDAPNTQLARICNAESPQQKIASTQHQVFVTYVIGVESAPVRFRLEWVLEGCGGHLTRPFDSFTSPGYPSGYPTNVDCEWLIEVDYMHSIELTIHDINTEKQKGCYFDRLQAYSGEDAKAPLLIEICYSEKPVVYTSFGNKMFVKFHSDVTYAARGFNASYRRVPLICGGKFTADSGIIQSTNYPQNYPHKQNCEWLLQVNQNYLVNLTFLDFDLENTVNCSDDYVKVYDGPTRNSPLLATLCRNQLPLPLISSSNEMLVVMRTDGIVSAKGFKAQYNTACGARITVKDQGYLKPSWSNVETQDAQNCTWTLIAEDPEDHITLTFTHMEVSLDLINDFQTTSYCSVSFLEVHEGQSIDGPSRGKWCDNVVPLPVTSTGNAVTVHLFGLFELGHFVISYSVLNSACGGTYTSYKGKIASPNYPNSYPLNSECIWILNNSPGNKLKLSFTEFDLQQSENCDLDYLEIRENSGIGKLVSVSCGTSIEPVESSTKLWIKFKSDGEGVAKGFVAEYQFLSGNDLSGSYGHITSPLYPQPFKMRDTVHWRITVNFQESIRIEIKDLFIESNCISHLRIYDGYDNAAPVLLDSCGLNTFEPITTTTNVAYIELEIDLVRIGSWFDLTWLQVPRDEDVTEVDAISNCTELITVGNSANYQLTSPGWPNGYADNLRCTWVFTSAPGTHLSLTVLILDLEETENCAADSLSVYDGNGLDNSDSLKLIQRMCFSNSSFLQWNAGNVMTVKFETDGYVNKTGFRATVHRDCGGKLTDPNGEITVDPESSRRRPRNWHVTCEWNVEVKPGRTIEVKVTEMLTGQSLNCAESYVLLKNGDETTSSLLGNGKYCPNSTVPTLQTSGNRFYVKVSGVQPTMHFKLQYREIGMNCGGEYILRGKELEISTPNYPNIPPPYTECTWTVMAPTRDRISIHFIDRFDLSYSFNCEREYVEIRDGGTDSSKLLGRFCKDVAPSSMMTAGNMMYIHFYSELQEPKNGFKATLSVGEACGGIIRGTTGQIVSPNYPFLYKKNQTCIWWIVAPIDHTLKLQFTDIDLPMTYRCDFTDVVIISDKIPEDDSNSTEIGRYCGNEKPGIIESLTNEAIVQFKSDNFEFRSYRGFNLNFVSSPGTCGGELTAMSGIIKSNGYPNAATRPRYCDWRIKLPLGYQVVVDILDVDIPYTTQPPQISYSLLFYNDLKSKSRIMMISQNSSLQQIRSSSNTMAIGYTALPGYRGFKLRYSAAVPAPCGGLVKEIKGNLSGPTIPPFNESSYYCKWSIEAPDSLANTTGLTFSIRVTGVLGGIRSYVLSKFCLNYQYISLTDVGMICGNITEPMYLRSPKLVNELIIVNGTYGRPMNYNLQYQWQPCGGMLEGPLHVISTPNISFPINCVWYADYPDTGELIKLSFSRSNLGPCDKSYISVRNGGSFSPEVAKFCGNIKPHNITSSSNRLWIEYFASATPNDFEFTLEPANSGCGGVLHGKSRYIMSPNFPKQYSNNSECTWEINGENGYHLGLVFVDRFNLEGGQDCKNDYVEVFDWVSDSNGYNWTSMGRVCGRETPRPFNSTNNLMKVTFHSNDKVEGDGFKAIWYENCGGVIHVTSKTQIIKSPSYPSLYRPNLFCNYTLIAPDGEEVLVNFLHFQLERSRRDCRFDNLTITKEVRYGFEEDVYCGDNKPPTTASSKLHIVFRTDSYIQRTGFVFKYSLKSCGGNLTQPGEIQPLMQNMEYFSDLSCIWTIQAPEDKNIVLRFEKFVTEYTSRCFYDNVEIYEGTAIDYNNKMAELCGNLTEHLPVYKSSGNTMLVRFTSDGSRNYDGFSAKVLFVKSVEAGCGGNVNLTETRSLPFRTQKSSTYDNLEDCYWIVKAAPEKNIKLIIDSMDIKNRTNKTRNEDKCTGDYLEVRDGPNPFSPILGKYCGDQTPRPILSSSNTLWIRFFSDGTIQGTGAIGTLETVDSPCGINVHTISETVQQLTSPNYPNSYGTSVNCRWILRSDSYYTQRLKIQFIDFDLPDSPKCNGDYVEITDKTNQKYIDEGFGSNFIWSGSDDNSQYMDIHSPLTSYKYCGKGLPHDYYSYSSEIEVRFRGSVAGHKGFKLEFTNATCNRNYTSEQGRILHEGMKDCWFTITAPVNYTISLYFNRFMLYDPEECAKSSLRIYEGEFDGKLLATYCGIQTPSPIFSTGNKLSIRSEWYTVYEYYDITFTTTNAGRGCGGRLYNYAGTITSPLYPNEYRSNAVCTWDVSVPRGLKVVLEFSVFDIGDNNACENKPNTVKIYDFTSDGERILANTYCGGDNPAPFQTNSERVQVEYTSTMNNIGTGWVMTFKGQV